MFVSVVPVHQQQIPSHQLLRLEKRMKQHIVLQPLKYHKDTLKWQSAIICTVIAENDHTQCRWVHIYIHGCWDFKTCKQAILSIIHISMHDQLSALNYIECVLNFVHIYLHVWKNIQQPDSKRNCSLGSSTSLFPAT